MSEPMPQTPRGPRGALRAKPTVRSSALATASGRILFIMAVVSLLLHAAIGVAAWDRPIGFVDPAMMHEARPPLRVKRSAYDLVLDPARGRGTGDEAPSLEDVSLALLEEVDEPPPVAPPEPELELRELEEQPPQAPSGELAIDLPPFELPAEVLAGMTDQVPGELGYQPGPGDDASPGEGAGLGGGGAAEGARQLLAQAGFVSRGGGGGSAPVAPVRDAAPLDERLLDMPLESPEFDFAGIALEETTKLDVPEHLDNDFDYYLSRYQPEGQRGYFRVDIVAKQSLRRLKAMPKDVVFLIDTSSSIPQEWVQQMIRGVQQGLRALNEGDRFNVVLFDENPAFFSTEGNQPATIENIEKAISFLSSARSKGWTDVNAALSQLLVRDVQAERVYELVLISDGVPTRGVLDTRELINLITRDNSLAASIYCVGVGREPNRELLEFLAYRNKGFCIFVGRVDEVADTVRALMSRLRYPLIKNVQVNVAGPEISEVHPLTLPNIHQGERFSVFGRYLLPAEFTMRVTGTNFGQGVDFTFTRNLRLAPDGERSIAHGWAFWKLHHLYSEMIRRGDTEALREQIEQLRKAYDLKTLY